MPNRVLAFVRRTLGLSDYPEPPPFNRAAPGAFAIFMDEDEREILYTKPWPYYGLPYDERTNSSEWLIGGQRFGPSHQDAAGNWIFRRIV